MLLKSAFDLTPPETPGSGCFSFPVWADPFEDVDGLMAKARGTNATLKGFKKHNIIHEQGYLKANLKIFLIMVSS